VAKHQSIPEGFSAEEWAQAVESGRIIVVATKPRRPRLIRMALAPIQFLTWTINVRSGDSHAAPHKWDRALPTVH
jgi:hypothetical protein